MAKKVAPGVLCKIIQGNKGPTSPNIGRHCRAVALQPKEHLVWGPLWECESVDGKPFVMGTQLHNTASSMVATFAEDWLEPIEDEPPQQLIRETEKELES